MQFNKPPQYKTLQSSGPAKKLKNQSTPIYQQYINSDDLANNRARVTGVIQIGMLDEHLVQLLRSRNKLPKLPPIIPEASQTQDLASILVRSTQHDAEIATFRDRVCLRISKQNRHDADVQPDFSLSQDTNQCTRSKEVRRHLPAVYCGRRPCKYPVSSCRRHLDTHAGLTAREPHIESKRAARTPSHRSRGTAHKTCHRYSLNLHKTTYQSHPIEAGCKVLGMRSRLLMPLCIWHMTP